MEKIEIGVYGYDLENFILLISKIKDSFVLLRNQNNYLL